MLEESSVGPAVSARGRPNHKLTFPFPSLFLFSSLPAMHKNIRRRALAKKARLDKLQ